MDSLIALYWIESKRELKQFAQNRVNEVLRLTSSDQWFYYKGTDNPAGLGTRSTTAAELKENQLWFHGPNWSGEVPNSWPLKDLRDLEPMQESLEEIRNIKLPKATTETISLQIAEFNIGVKLTELLNPSQVSNCRKLYRVTGFVVRFVNNLKARIKRGKLQLQTEENLTVKEIETAERLWLLEIQRELTADAKYFEKLEALLNLFHYQMD